MDCMLGCLRDEKIESLFPGLTITDAGLPAPLEGDFPCCDLTGLNWDDSSRTVRRCAIATRCRGLEELLGEFKSLWQENGVFPPALTPTQQAWFFLWLKERNHKRTGRGYALTKKTTGPSPFWWFAVASLWRFHLGVHIMRLDLARRKSFTSLLPSKQRIARFQDRPAVFFLENVGGLWDDKVRTAFEEIIRWCSLAGVPLWIELSETHHSRANPVNKARKGMSIRGFGGASLEQRIVETKDTRPLSWLSADSLSRLEEICQLPRDMLK